ncbi:MAG: EI24 domain-containing protein [Verrucomicrobia bacterium]|nr:EI24 domain-containing protein [Verrucomicrobiota bacterium]MDA1048556.1 EI24 domain-containing protein [Verrucomicrobiota bacterium]
MLASFIMAFGQLNDSRFIKPLLYSLGLSLVVALIALPLGYLGFEWLNQALLSWLEGGDSWWMDTIEWSLRVLGILIMLVVLFFAFGSVQTAFLGLFLDDVVTATRDKNHPTIQLEPPPSLSKSSWASTRFLGLSLSLNALILPIVLIGWFLPPLGLIVQLIANGYLFGKEYEDIIAVRFQTEDRLAPLKRTIFGTATAALFLVPVLNFVAPVISAAAFTNYIASRNE